MIAMTINLDELKALIVEFIVERGGDEEDLLRRLTLSDFLLWMQEKARLDAKERPDKRIQRVLRFQERGRSRTH